MSIRTRLALGTLAIALVILAPLVLALRSLEQLRIDTTALRDREFAAAMLLGRMRGTLDDLRRAETALLFVHDSASRAAMAQAIERLSLMADSLEGYQLDSAARNVRVAVREVSSYAPLEYRAALAGEPVVAESISTVHVIPAVGRVDRWIVAAERSLTERTRERVTAAAVATEQAWRLSAAALLIAAAIGLAIAIWLTRSVSRPIRELKRGMAAVADGDFEHRLVISRTRDDEFGQLAASFDSMATQLAQLDKLKAEFISVASHELKTPINVILGYLQLFEDGVYGELTPKQREVLDTLEVQAQSLARLVQQLLDVSRFEAGGGKLEVREIALDRFLDDLEKAFDVLAHQRGVRFRVARAAELPAVVVWDHDRMNEVLGNLLSNAFKFTERGGAVELTVDSEDDAIHMDVRDTGAGIPPEQLPHVFEKFFQADNQRRAAQVGTGLGLAIAKEIVEAHHGTITCESTPGSGTTFSITLPVRGGGRRPAARRVVAESAAP